MAVKLLNNAEQFKSIGTPGGNPPAGYQLHYSKTDEEFYRKNSNGQEFRIEGNGSKIFLSQTQI